MERHRHYLCKNLSCVLLYAYMAKDWTNIYKKYKGLWVALAEDEETVLGTGKTAREALEQAKKITLKTPFLTRMPENLAAYVGTV